MGGATTATFHQLTSCGLGISAPRTQHRKPHLSPIGGHRTKTKYETKISWTLRCREKAVAPPGTPGRGPRVCVQYLWVYPDWATPAILEDIDRTAPLTGNCGAEYREIFSYPLLSTKLRIDKRPIDPGKTERHRFPSSRYCARRLEN